MTANQINYQTMMEKVRNNHAVEEETKRHNKAMEDYNTGALANDTFRNQETKRHNLVMEQLNQIGNELSAKLGEIQNRGNELNYNAQVYRVSEEARHNQANELLTHQKQEQEFTLDLAQQTLNERKQRWTEMQDDFTNNLRSQAQEETVRHNKRTETLSFIGSVLQSAKGTVEAGIKASQALGLLG